MNALSTEDFQFVAGFLQRQTGISLGGDKAYLVENRLGELCRSVGMTDISALIQELKTRPGSENGQKLLEAMTTNETSFFRDIGPFKALQTQLLPELLEARQQTRCLRLWSAACSTGQEPYSLAMLLDSMLGPQRREWKLEILGTDLADKVLSRARAGQYSQLEVNRGLPADKLIRYFKKKGGDWHISEAIRAMVSFAQVNLLALPALPKFDVILCRNVLIYFDLETRRKVLKALRQRLAEDGYLFVGASEVLLGVTDSFIRLERCGAVCYQIAA